MPVQTTRTKFGMYGVAGFVAPRHLAAIKGERGVLIAAVDPADTVGILDSFFPGMPFFYRSLRFRKTSERAVRKWKCSRLCFHLFSQLSPLHSHL